MTAQWIYEVHASQKVTNYFVNFDDSSNMVCPIDQSLLES